MKKKLLTTLLAATMCVCAVFGSIISVSAETTENTTVGKDEADGGTTKDVEVVYEDDGTFTVTIPKTIVLDGTAKASDYDVTVIGDISSDKQITITPVDSVEDADGVNFYMSDQSGVALVKDDVLATVTQDETVWTSAELSSATDGATKSGNVSATDLSSGSWKGNFGFNITFEDVQ